MNYDLITTKEFEDGMATILQEINQVKSIVTKLQENNARDEWLTLEQLIEYLPGSVKPRTVYDWVHKREIPFHKREIPFHKRRNALFFLKSEIDAWTQIKKTKKLNKEQLFKGVTDENRIIK